MIPIRGLRAPARSIPSPNREATQVAYIHQRHDVWPPERVALLTELWGQGLPAREIGARLGISYSAVTAKARRLQLPARPSPIGRAA